MNRIRALREQRGWSQVDLAERAGVTRQLIGAVEAGRHVPSVAAALGLARALGLSVEMLFHDDPRVVSVTGPDLPAGTPLSTARIGDVVVGVPVTHGLANAEAWGLADAVAGDDGARWLAEGTEDGLVIAGCDPLLGLLAALVARRSGQRLLTAHASTDRSIDALADGRVHGVLVHAPAGALPRPPVPVRRWQVARWQVGLAAVARHGPPSIDELAEQRPRVVQRETGAGSQRALVRALQAIGAEARLPGPVGDGHLDVARRVAQGGGRAGVTMEAAAHAFGLSFAPLEAHGVELWLDERWVGSVGAAALIDALGAPALAQRVALLRGYDLGGCGSELRAS